jgi:LmbE family N-acetylglucosaminyl deacetylase
MSSTLPPRQRSQEAGATLPAPSPAGDVHISPSRRIAVISPHLDDAAFSLGALMCHEVRAGARVVTITVLANDPRSEGAAGSWDARCGFASAPEAARERRAEDLRACGLLGTTPLWLPFGDATYGRAATDAEIWDDLAPAIRDAETVLLPGYPLRHPDHQFVTRLVMERRRELSGRIGFYAEQPYAAGRLLGEEGMETARRTKWLGGVRNVTRFAYRLVLRETPMPPRVDLDGLTFERLEWRHLPASRSDRTAKRRAVTSYRSQLRPLGVQPMLGAWLYELAHRGEAVAWL